MSDVQQSPVPRGKTWYNGSTIDTGNYARPDLEGTTRVFKNTVAGTAGGIDTVRDAYDVYAVLVRNTSGVALLPGRLVTWATGYRHRRVDGYCTTTAQEVAGVVDDRLPSAGVPNGDMFWLLRKGHALVKTSLAADATNSIAEGAILYALTAVTSQSTTSGRFQPWVGTFGDTHTTNGTAGSIVMNQFGRAVSAKTTANTNVDCLVDLTLPT